MSSRSERVIVRNSYNRWKVTVQNMIWIVQDFIKHLFIWYEQKPTLMLWCVKVSNLFMSPRNRKYLNNDAHCQVQIYHHQVKPEMLVKCKVSYECMSHWPVCLSSRKLLFLESRQCVERSLWSRMDHTNYTVNFIHSFTRSFTHSLSHSFIHSLIQSTTITKGIRDYLRVRMVCI